MPQNNWSKQKAQTYIFYLCVIIVGCFYILPSILFGKDIIVTIHDYFDQNLPQYKMYRENDLFWKFDAPTKGFYEMSTLYYNYVSYNFHSLMYFVFNDFVAYTLNYYFSIIFGIFSMFLILQKILKLSFRLSLFVSISYAVLPIIPIWNIAAGTLPLIFIIFYYFAISKKNQMSLKVFILFIYPFFSNFVSVGIFICAFWFVCSIIDAIKNKHINPNLVIGFFLLCLGYVIVDIKLFYVIFILKTPLNRNIFIYPTGMEGMLKRFIINFKDYWKNGHYHASSMQSKIIFPISIIISGYFLLKICFSMKNISGTLTNKIKFAFNQMDKKIKCLLLLELIVFCFSGIAALYDSGLLDIFIKRFIPVLNGFNWGRVWILNRFLWYIIFALCLDIMINNKFNKIFPELSFSETKIFAILLLILQITYIISKPVYYNDQLKTWFNEIFVKTGIAKKVMPNKDFDNLISYKEFFSEELFNDIKKDISYSGEKVAAYGYEPSVLMYNGFNCIDGYNNAYPLKYMIKFRTLIAPELKINKEARDYYDSWGARMYLYGSSLNFSETTHNKITVPVNLNIDINVFNNDFGGTYILSRVELANADMLGISYVKKYYRDDSIYTIYLYKTI